MVMFNYIPIKYLCQIYENFNPNFYEYVSCWLNMTPLKSGD